MKKIFTLLFFAGFLTTGFAQSRRDQNDGNRNQSSTYSKPYDNGRDRNYQPQTRGNDRDYGYSQDRNNDRDRGYDKGHDNWKQKDNWDRNNGRGNDNYDACDDVRPVQSAPRPRGSLLQIILSGVIRL